jgi:hypothetical protein
MNALLATSFFCFSLLLALSGIWRRFQEEKYRGSLLSLSDRLKMLSALNSKQLPQRGQAFSFFNRVILGDLQDRKRDADMRIFVQLQLQEHLASLSDELRSDIIDLLISYEDLTLQFAWRLSVRGLLFALRMRILRLGFNWDEILFRIPEIPMLSENVSQSRA